MTELKIGDLGGETIGPHAFVADELIGYVANLNPNLGTEKDPLYPSYKRFQDQINTATIHQITPEQMSTGKLDDIDLTGAINSSEMTNTIKSHGCIFKDNEWFLTMAMMAGLVVPNDPNNNYDKRHKLYKNTQLYTPYDFS